MNLLEIDSSLFCLSLDGTTNNLQLRSAHALLDELTNPRWDDHLHNTAYGERGHNRWFDKTITVSLESNTRLGMMGEHSPCDALIPSILGEFCVKEPMILEEFESLPTEAKAQTGWRQLVWMTDPQISKECRRVEKEVQLLVDDSDDSQLWFDEFGVDWMRAGKSWGWLSRFQAKLTYSETSEAFSRRVHSNGIATCMEPGPREANGHLRNSIHKIVPAWPNRSHSIT